MSDVGDVRDLRDLRVLGEARVRQGWSRVRSAWWPILQAAIGGSVAFAIARYGLQHPYPFFAPVSTWIALGFTANRSIRRVAELAVGVALGVALGDVVVHVIGTGAWQVGVVLFVSALLARFLDRGPMLTTQAGVQAIVIVGLPATVATGGPLGRWLDAVVGGALALAVALLTPANPVRGPRALGRTAVEELAAVLHTLARGFSAHDHEVVEHGLVQARATQPALAEWSSVTVQASELARISPANRRHHADLAALALTAERVDRAARSARVLARRSLPLLDAPVPGAPPARESAGDGSAAEPEPAHDLRAVAVVVDRLARATDELAAAVGTGRAPTRAAENLVAAAGALDPFVLAPRDWQAQSLVLLLRSLAVDLEEGAGVDPAAARRALPEI